MARKTAGKKPLTKAQLQAKLAADTGLAKEQVAAIFEALAAEIKRSLGSKGAGVITILDLVKIEKMKVPACPTWPDYVRVTVVPELLSGPDDRCARGLHTYFQSPATNDRGHPICGLCGNDEIDWERLHRRRITDVKYTVAQLQTDRFRCKWWSKDVDRAAERRALKMGPSGIKDAVRKRVEQSVSRVYEMSNGTVQPFRDGAQTPWKGNIIYYGQHATATCCRKCIQEWHGIPLGRELKKKESGYLVGLLLEYIRFRMPDLGKSRLTQEAKSPSTEAE